MSNQYKDYKYPDLKYLLANYYHEDFWDDYKNHEDGWNDFIEKDNSAVLGLKKDVKILSEEQEDAIYKIISDYQVGGLHLESSKDALKWLNDLREFLDK